MSDSIILTVGPEEADNPTFGHILLGFRNRINLTRSEAARRIGVTSEYVRLMEKGERSPALGMALKMLDAYDVPWTLDGSQVYFENVSAEFSGRIKEARGSVPALIYYTVTQERTVKVSATNYADALFLAERALAGEKRPDDQINIQQAPTITSVHVREIQ